MGMYLSTLLLKIDYIIIWKPVDALNNIYITLIELKHVNIALNYVSFRLVFSTYKNSLTPSELGHVIYILMVIIGQLRLEPEL